MKPVKLPSDHYASGWKTEGVVKSLEELTDLGRRYASLSAEASEKQSLLLDICQSFHPYLMKYLDVICSGHVPVVGHGLKKFNVNADVKPFLMYFLAKGKTLNLQTMLW